MPSADLVIKNARVITMDAARPYAEAVAVSGDMIVWVGDDDGVAEFTGAGTKIIDGTGRTVVPGFNDAHLHLFSLMRQLLGVDVSPAAVSSIAEIKAAIRRAAESTPPGQWLTGHGFNEFYLAEKRFPTRADLDEAAPHHPVLLAHRSLHAGVLNSRALELAGIGLDTPEPPGARIERDLTTGEPNGILYEMLGYLRGRVLPPLTSDELDEAVRRADRLFVSHGITSIQEATYRNDPVRWRTVGGFKESGALRSRITMMAGTDCWPEFQKAGLVTGAGDEQLRLGAVKVMVTQTSGGIYHPIDELKQLALDAHRAGFQLAFHAEEEAVIEAVIDTLEYVNSHSPIAGRRHRIEHCSECTPRLLERLPALGVVIVTQPPFLYYSGERYLTTVAPDILSWLYRIRSPLEAGLTVAGSSDTPVVPFDPLAGIGAAVTRKAQSGQVLQPEEAVTPEQALALYTVNAALSSFEEDIKGTITPGKLADLVVLGDDPTRVEPNAIKDIKVEMTLIGGKVVWEG